MAVVSLKEIDTTLELKTHLFKGLNPLLRLKLIETLSKVMVILPGDGLEPLRGLAGPCRLLTFLLFKPEWPLSFPLLDSGLCWFQTLSILLPFDKAGPGHFLL